MFPNSIFAIPFLGNTDAETDSEAEGEKSSSLFSAIEADSISIPLNRQLSCGELAVLKGQVRTSVERAIDMMEMFVSIEDEVDADKTICAMETGDVQDLGETGPSEVPVQKGIENIEASCSWITTFHKKKENSSIHGFQVEKHHYHYLYHVHRYILRLWII
nr:uncharacterized protein LOC117685445 [Crassostrea gigas]